MTGYRKIVSIDESRCNGCGLCIPKCAEGALQIVNGKAKLVSDVYCDGLGNCLGECPEDAITIIEREAEDFDEVAVKERVTKLENDAFTPEAELSHWPIQLHLVSPKAHFLNGRELLLCADCVPFAYPDFHRKLLAGKSLIVGCPKLDDVDIYKRKLLEILSGNDIPAITLVHMEVPCCFGLASLLDSVLGQLDKKIPVKTVIIKVDGSIK